ncbi:unnamed protein product [Sympodiomycopsis kandeliae]
MWVVEGHFEEGTHPLKVLKPNNTYTIGRKPPAELIIASKTVSQCTASIEVGTWTAEQVSDFESRPPQVTLHNSHSSKSILVKRPLAPASPDQDQSTQQDTNSQQSSVQEFNLPPDSHLHLDSSDEIIISLTHSIRLQWHNTQFQAGSKTDKSILSHYLPQCTEYGLHLVRNIKSIQTNTSHLLLQEIRVVPTVLTALIKGIHLVSPSFLDDFIHALRNQTLFPDPNEYTPLYTNEENHTSSTITKGDRSQMFKGTTALCFHKGIHPDQACHTHMDLLRLAGGHVSLLSLDDPTVALSSTSDAHRTLRPFRTRALSYYSSCGQLARNAPDGGLVVMIHDNDISDEDDGKINNIKQATRSMDIRWATDGTRAIAAAIFHNDPRSQFNEIAPLPGHTASQQHSSRANSSSPPPPTIATAGSSMAPVLHSVNASQVPPPTAEQQQPQQQQPQQQQEQQQPQQPRDQPQEQPQEQPQQPMPPPGQGQGDQPPQEEPLPKRPLKRKAPMARGNAFDQIFGKPDEPSQQVSSGSQSQPEEATRTSSAMDPPASKSIKRDPEPEPPRHHLSAAQLKKRAAGTQRQSRLSDIFGPSSSSSAGMQAADSAYGIPGSQSVIGGGESGKVSKYRALLEQDEMASTQGGDGPSKQSGGEEASPSDQKAEASGDVEMEDAHRPSTSTSAQSESHRATNDRRHDRNSPKPRQTATSTKRAAPPQVIRAEAGPRGQAPGEAPDCEPQLLEALSTHRRGKKGQMDDFDKEFNGMRLSKPSVNQKHASRDGRDEREIQDDEDYKVWKAAAIEEMGIPVGNFIQVDFVSLVRPQSGSTTRGGSSQTSTNGDWSNRPNFKKFNKTKSNSTTSKQAQRKKIAMDLTEAQDFGMGVEYLEGKPKVDVKGFVGAEGVDEEEQDGHAENADDDDDVPSNTQGRSKASTSGTTGKRSILKALAESSDDEDGSDARAAEMLKKRSRNRTTSSGPSTNRRRVILHDDLDDDVSPDEDISFDLRLAKDVEDEDLSMATTARQGKKTSSSTTGRKRAAILDSSSDDEAGRGGGTPSTISANQSQNSTLPTSTSNKRKRPGGSASASGGTHSTRASNAGKGQDVDLQLFVGQEVDEDEDEDTGFKGFKSTPSASSSKRSRSKK